MIRLVIPLVVFLGLIVLMIAGLQTTEKRKEVQSPLIGKPVPQVTLPDLHEPGRMRSTAELEGEPYIINVWGSWCWACRVEHPFVEKLGQEAGVPLVGFNWKDERDDALEWLDQFGDAWHFHLTDPDSRAAIDLGVYGAPETFLVDQDGIVRHKHIGPIDANSYEDLIRRVMELKAEADS